MKQEALKIALDALETELSIDWGNQDEFNASAEKMYEAIAAIKEALTQPEQEPVGDDWTPCLKLPVVVHVRQQRLGESHVSTREGITPVKPDDLIMRGVSGEEYPIGRAIFEQTYSLNTTPPQPEQEPVACDCNQGQVCHICDPITPPQRTEQKPVAWRAQNWSNLHGKYGYRDFDDPVCGIDGKPSSNNEPLYTHPPQRTWVGLTDEEIARACGWSAHGWWTHPMPYEIKIAKAIEAKLKEKNT